MDSHGHLLNRMDRIQSKLEEKQVDALLVSNLKNIRYLTGFTGTTGFLIIKPDEATLFVDSRYTEQAQAQSKTAAVRETVRDVLKDVLTTLKQGAIKHCAFEADRLVHAEFRRLKETLVDVELVSSTRWVDELRAIKDKREIVALREAVEIADKAYEDFLTWLAPGMLEREVAARLEYFQRMEGGDRKPSETVVASGYRTALPHGIATDRMIQADEPVMIDVGIVVDGYTSDLTRTVHLGHPSDPEFEKIYQIVLDAQAEAKERMRPGMTGREIDALARDHIETRGYGQHFGHSLGHSLGLEIHERPGLSSVEDTVIEPGMVVTVEPGIYLAERFGVRIEDIVLVTEEGCEVLTSCSRELMEL